MNIILSNLQQSYATDINVNPKYSQLYSPKPVSAATVLTQASVPTPVDVPDISKKTQSTHKVVVTLPQPAHKVSPVSKSSNGHNVFSLVLELYNDNVSGDSFEKFVSDFALNMATELDEKDLYEKFKYNSRGGMGKTFIQSALQCDHRDAKSNKLSLLFYLGDFLGTNIYVNNGEEFIALTKIRDRDNFYIHYNRSNKSHVHTPAPMIGGLTEPSYKHYDYIDRMSGKYKDEVNDKLLMNFGIINDIKNVKNIYISNPLLKSMTAYKLPDLITKASELKVDISGVKKQKKAIYDKIYDFLNN
jgi:hypothetical protein